MHSLCQTGGEACFAGTLNAERFDAGGSRNNCANSRQQVTFVSYDRDNAYLGVTAVTPHFSTFALCCNVASVNALDAQPFLDIDSLRSRNAKIG